MKNCGRLVVVAGFLTCWPLLARGATIHLPRDHGTIAAALAAASPGDTVLVAAGTHRERLRLKEGVTVRSAGVDVKGTVGLKRAEVTIIEGEGAAAKQPGVILGEGATLDGFTVRKVGVFDRQEYDRHHATLGELLLDERGAVGVGGNFPAIGIPGVTAVIRNCIVSDNGHAGIGCSGAADQRNNSLIVGNVVCRNRGGGIAIADGATPLVEANRCFNNLRAGIGNRKSRALIVNNECFENVRAGIGIREGACPTVRGNRCYRNRRAGIGVRMKGTNPVLEDNDCLENFMAGIGNRDGAAPIIRNNRCNNNEMAGIGARLGARPVIVDNECTENRLAGIGCREGAVAIVHNNRCRKNEMAGIGIRDGARALIEGNECRENTQAGIGARHKASVTILNNRCLENGKVALGLRHGTTAHVAGNELVRTGGMPPMIAVRERSSAVITGNRIRGGGGCGLLVEGTAHLTENRLEGTLGKSGSAIWALPKSDITASGNRVDAYRNLLDTTGCRVTVRDNLVSQFKGTAIAIKNAVGPAQVHGNIALSKEAQDRVLALEGRQGTVAENVRKEPTPADSIPTAGEKLWKRLRGEEQDETRIPERTGQSFIQQGAWKLVILHGHQETSMLYNLTDDPQEKKNLVVPLEQVAFRLRGLLERKEGAEFKLRLQQEAAGR